jgi:hypothetical protein
MESDNHATMGSEEPPVRLNPMGTKEKGLLFFKYVASFFLSFFKSVASVLKSVASVLIPVASNIIQRLTSLIPLTVSFIMWWISYLEGVFRALALARLWSMPMNLNFYAFVTLVAICLAGYLGIYSSVPLEFYALVFPLAISVMAQFMTQTVLLVIVFMGSFIVVPPVYAATICCGCFFPAVFAEYLAFKRQHELQLKAAEREAKKDEYKFKLEQLRLEREIAAVAAAIPDELD